MKSTELLYHELFRDVLGKRSVTIEQTIEPNVFFSSQIGVNVSFNINSNFFYI